MARGLMLRQQAVEEPLIRHALRDAFARKGRRKKGALC